MTSKEFKTERNQPKKNINKRNRILKKKKELKAFQSIVAIFKEILDIFLEWLMKGPKELGTISVNSSTNSNLKPKQLSGNLKGS